MGAQPDRTASRDAPPATIGVVGAGTMGAGIAQVALEAGDRVVIHDPDPEALARGRERIADGLARRARSRSALPAGAAAGPLDPEDALTRLRSASDLGGLAAASEVIVEAVTEDLELKRRLFATLDAAASPTTLLATNTSALSVAAIASATRRPGRVVGLHFFNPAPLMPLVEVVAPVGTAAATVDAAIELVRRWAKTPVRTADTPGFIVNRVNRPFTLEALAMLETGAGTVESIDEAIRADGFPMGPFELMDLVGIDVNLAAARGIFEGFAYEPRYRPSAIQERLVEAGRLGRKSREGFYWYADDGRRLGVAGAFAVEPEPLDPPGPSLRALPAGGPADGPAAMHDPTAERIVLAIVNEAYRAVGEGVADPSDVDLALRLGAGHPSGPFERVAAFGGPAAVLARLDRWRRAGPRFDPAPALVAAAEAAT